jgi:succinate dehydrogenase/fumarate reductase flavoprotein subunit
VVAEGRLVPHDSIAGLAEAIGVDPTALVGTIERYNGFGVEGRDADFGKAGRFLAPVARPPFYGVLVRPTVVNLTASGLRIDGDTRVLTNRGTPLPGLHAAGECVGGIIGPVYVGSGNSLGTCTTMGRVAGRTAATTSAGAS